MHRFLLATLAVSTLGTPALAQETRASMMAKFDAEFAARDTNKDGTLSKAEVEAGIARMRVGSGASNPEQAKQLSNLWFARADANKDGKVTKPEAQALLAAVFKRYDANGDGKVGTGERAAAKAGVAGER